MLHVTEPGCPLKGVFSLTGVEKTDVYFDADVGTLVHEVMREMIDRIMIGLDPVLQLSIDAVTSRDDRLMQTYNEDKLRVLLPVSNGYRWLEKEGFDVIKEHFLARESPLAVPLLDENDDPISLMGKPVYISGTPDLVLDYAIIDWKSGKSRSTRHALQISVYSILSKLSGLTEDNLPGRIFYMGVPMKEKVIKKTGAVHKYYERRIEGEKLEEYAMKWYASALDYVELVRDGLEGGMQAGDQESNSDCYFCPYRSICWGDNE